MIIGSKYSAAIHPQHALLLLQHARKVYCSNIKLTAKTSTVILVK